MRVDFKETVWRQFKFDATKEQEELIANAVSSRKVFDSDSFYEFLVTELEFDMGSVQNEFNIETAEPMIPFENDNQPTIEVFGEEDAEDAIATN